MLKLDSKKCWGIAASYLLGGCRQIAYTQRGDEATKQDSIQTKANADNILVKMYPNPAADFAMLQLNKDISPLQLKVSDAFGSLVEDKIITTSNGYYRMNTSAWSSGIYYVTLYGAKEKIFSGKLCVFVK